jgi:hypothetical protein
LYDKLGLRGRKTLFWEGNMKDNCTFPETVEYKSCTATIYYQRHRDVERFEVRYYDVDGSMQRLTFPTYSCAKKFADAAVKEIATNREQFVTLRGRDAFDYQTAVEILGPLGLTISQAVTMMAELERQLDGRGTVQEAVKYFLENRPQRSPDITVRQVVDQLLALKQKEGEVGPIYLRDLRLRLNKFAKAFQCPISKVSPQEIRDYELKASGLIVRVEAGSADAPWVGRLTGMVASGVAASVPSASLARHCGQSPSGASAGSG